MKKKLLLTALITALFLGIGCTAKTSENTVTGNAITDADVTVEVYHFHATHQCSSCILLGELTEKTIKTYFLDEFNSGKIKFDHINVDLPENKDLVEKYGPTGSSIWIGTYINGEFYKEQNTRVWYKLNNEEDFMSYLKEILSNRLLGVLI